VRAECQDEGGGQSGKRGVSAKAAFRFLAPGQAASWAASDCLASRHFVDEIEYNDGSENDPPIGNLNARDRCFLAKPFHEFSSLSSQGGLRPAYPLMAACDQEALAQVLAQDMSPGQGWDFISIILGGAFAIVLAVVLGVPIAKAVQSKRRQRRMRRRFSDTRGRRRRSRRHRAGRTLGPECLILIRRKNCIIAAPLVTAV